MPQGGGLYQGGSRDDRYNLTFIVENAVRIGKPFIAVSIAYRLGPWGFLQSEEVSASGDTNIGLRDQRLALHWLHENIDAFGGDCRKVTIWGESAGAGSVGWHITAYGGRDDGLFRAGIMQSGNPVPYNGYETLAKYQPQYDALVDATNCTMAADTLACLREVPSDSLAQLFSDTSSLNEGWRPIVDGDFIQRLASAQLAEGAFVKVPILTGANTDEGTAFGPQGIDTDDQFRSYVADRTENPYIPQDLADEALAAYPNTPAYFIPPVENIGNYTFPASYGAQYRRAAAYAGDVTFIAHRRGASETWAANGLAAYSYRFNTVPAGIDFYVGATHFQEVAFVSSVPIFLLIWLLSISLRSVAASRHADISILGIQQYARSRIQRRARHRQSLPEQAPKLLRPRRSHEQILGLVHLRFGSQLRGIVARERSRVAPVQS